MRERAQEKMKEKPFFSMWMEGIKLSSSFGNAKENKYE